MFPVSDVIPSRTTPFVTLGLIAVNTLAFLYELQLDRQGVSQLAHALGAVPIELTWPKLIASSFIHDGWIHFGGNMLYLWIFGDNVEGTLGHGAYLCFYLLAGALAALVYVGLHPASAIPLIGASGAVAAVMGAHFVLYPNSPVLTAVFLILFWDVVEVPAIVLLAVWLLLQLLSGLASMGAQAADAVVAFGAHAAGFVAGAATGFAWRKRRRWQ
jgi:membrane associated rhomboid family serine protease